MKNNYFVSESVLYIECTNVSPSQYMSCSLSDYAVLADHRWRVIDGNAVTTRTSGTLEYRHTIDSVLFDAARTATFTRRDKNPLNCQRENIKMSPSARENHIVTRGKVSYLLLPNAQTVVVDTDDIPTIAQYTWYSLIYRGQPAVLARYTTPDGVKKTQLARLLMGVTAQDSRRVKHRNGDKMDCRKQNLYIEERE